ncbi:unnamed protein product [Microthlaspi erraticum]|uniref:Uncharacterized protein n=1 Tax=Microthlaspi erraticum TaxID=1685480 RepID=A0A6D2KUU0_9BRAS|nr:unnamed protein product [Microthlaspi erraticum]
MFRARPKHARPGKHSPRSAKLQASRQPRTTKRASRETKPRGRATLACHGRCIRPSRERTSHVRPRISSAKSIRSTTPADRESSDPDRSDSPTTDVRPIVPHDRPNAAVDPKPF